VIVRFSVLWFFQCLLTDSDENLLEKNVTLTSGMQVESLKMNACKVKVMFCGIDRTEERGT